jgi:hypothetical protein
MRNVSDERCRENQNTHFVFNNIFFFENRAICEIMGKYDRDREGTEENVIERRKDAICMPYN